MSIEKLKETENRFKLFGTPELQAVAKIESSLLKGARKYFEENDFVEIVVPHLTKATGACENILTMFTLDYFGQRAYLSQTGQLYLEVMTPFLEKVWCIIHSFRAEPEVDERHLTEFTLIEMEFLGDFEELIKHIEGTIYSMIQEVIKSRKDELEFLNANIKGLKKVKPPFKRITYTKAVELLAEEGVKWGDDLKSKHEKMLVKLLGNEPLFITHYPKVIKFFNMRENDENPNIVNSTDLILPFSGEAVGAAEREHTYEKLYKRLKESTMLKMLIENGGSIEDFKWYLDFYKNNNVELHSGCGIGLNRVTQFVLGSDDIRTTTIYPMNRESLF